MDIGNLLYDMFVLGWLGLLASPGAVIGLVAFAIRAITTVRDERRQRGPV